MRKILLLLFAVSALCPCSGPAASPEELRETPPAGKEVRAVSFRATVIETFDGSVITLPDTNVLSKDFRNWTHKGSRMRRDLHVGVAYGTDLKLVRQTLFDAAAALPSIYKQPPPEVCCPEFQENAIDFTLRVWVRTGAQLIVLFNQLDVHFDAPPALPENCNESLS